MNITKRAKIMVAAVSLLGAVGVAGTAFTATGLTNNAGPTQFVGGSIDQTVTGAALSTITYTYSDAPTNTSVSGVGVVFDAASSGKTVAVTVHQGATDTTLTCLSDDATPVAGKVGTATFGANCAASNLTGVTGLTVAVS